MSGTAPVNAEVQDLINWCTQPAASPFVGDAHALSFFLNRNDGLSYNGLMFFLPAHPPASRFNAPHFIGTGRLSLNNFSVEKFTLQTLPSFVRLSMSLKGAVVTEIEFLDANGPGSLPGNRLSIIESDAAFSGETFIMGAGEQGWTLSVHKTTLRL